MRRAAKILQILSQSQRRVPYTTLKLADRYFKQLAPELIKAVQRAADYPASLLQQRDRLLPVYGLYLLAKFRETRAYPAVCQWMLLPGDMPMDLCEEVILQDGHSILAGVSGGDTGPLQRIIETEAANEYVRDTAFGALVSLVAWGEVAREQVAAYFKRLFEGQLARPGNLLVWNSLISACDDLGTAELLPRIREAYEHGWADESFMSWEYAKRSLANPPGYNLSRFAARRRPIDDIAGAIEEWLESYLLRIVGLEESARQRLINESYLPLHRWEPWQT